MLLARILGISSRSAASNEIMVGTSYIGCTEQDYFGILGEFIDTKLNHFPSAILSLRQLFVIISSLM